VTCSDLLRPTEVASVIKDLLRLRRTTKDENRVQLAGSRRRVSLCYKHPCKGGCLEVGYPCEDLDPA